MATPEELEAAFWKSLKSDMTMMLGIVGAEDGHMRPMTAQLDDSGTGPIWFFCSRDNMIVKSLKANSRAMAAFTAKKHDLFAAIHGNLSLDEDKATIDRLWNRFIAAWFEGGKNDPKLALLRLDPDKGEVWENGSSFVAGIKLLMGVDPKKDYQDKVAKIDLH